jgi:hypothetical protein
MVRSPDHGNAGVNALVAYQRNKKAATWLEPDHRFVIRQNG